MPVGFSVAKQRVVALVVATAMLSALVIVSFAPPVGAAFSSVGTIRVVGGATAWGDPDSFLRSALSFDGQHIAYDSSIECGRVWLSSACPGS